MTSSDVEARLDELEARISQLELVEREAHANLLERIRALEAALDEDDADESDGRVASVES